MLKRQIFNLFKEYDSEIQSVIAQVIKFEQENGLPPQYVPVIMLD